MKKIMFDDRFGLTQAVLEGRKTMTRRIINDQDSCDIFSGSMLCLDKAKYHIGEVVAVAQSYQTILDTVFVDSYQWKYGYIREVEDAHELLWEDIAGRDNKMFVQADLMPHQIRITNVKIERLQDISDEDCLREGIRTLTSAANPTHYTFDNWRFRNKVFRCSDTPREAFAALINKISGIGTWEGNPYVFVYDFELVEL